MEIVKVAKPSFNAEINLLPIEDHQLRQRLPSDFHPEDFDAILFEGYDDEAKPRQPKNLRNYKIAVSEDERALLESFKGSNVRYFNVDIYKQRVQQTLDDLIFFSDFYREITLAQKAAFIARNKIDRVCPRLLIHWGSGHTDKIIEYLEMPKSDRLELIKHRRAAFNALFGNEWTSSILEIRPRKKNNNFDVIDVFEESSIRDSLRVF